VKRATSRTARKSGRERRAIAIRMYNVGFGDCFLIRLPSPDRDRKILIDCGVHPSGPGPREIRAVVEQIASDVMEDGRPEIDVVIASHRHADHVSGFKTALWDEVIVHEVWMPWTENPRDAEARRILETQSKTAANLAAVPGLAADALALANNSLTNAAAMQTLHEGFRGQPLRRFLPPRRRDRATFTVDTLPGVVVHAMGPSRDPEIIRDMDPPEGASYLLLSANSQTASGLPPLAFDSEWIIDELELWQKKPHLVLKSWEIGTLRNLGQLDALSVAVSLEKAINGTSLMLMFQIGKAYLLFPGDAQWGTWQRALADPEWRDLLAKTTFYKVGHHGSHNATPKAFVNEVLGTAFWAMACTRAGTLTWDIPRKPLLQALRKKCPQVIRSDRADVKDPAAVHRDKTKHFVDLAVPY
jgi:beta-lactamase superfamily II metal-dependent hydrolase